jgi:putative ABC transport system ATP-binding protein
MQDTISADSKNRSAATRGDAPAIHLEDVRLTLASTAGPVNILNGVSMRAARGEAVALLGPSGSGKSSLLMVAAGLEAASSGTVTIAGQTLNGLGEDALARFRRAHVGIVFQSFHLIPTMTAEENVAVPLELMGRKDAFAKAREGLHAVGLGERMHHYPGQLSGGEQQRVALARAIVHEPEILFADEPTGNLDGKTGAGIADLLFSLRARAGATLFLVTHEETLAQRCDRILRMKDGLIVAEERPGRGL